MRKLHSVKIDTHDGNKEISVYCDDVTSFEEDIDILTTSAYIGSYVPTPRTVFEALYRKGICVKTLSLSPEIDLRNPCNVWLSKQVSANLTKIKRIGCIELLGRHLYSLDFAEMERAMINSIRAYFQMLDIAAVYGVNMSTIALPLLGSGSQHISSKLLLMPLLNECVSFLKRNKEVKRILFIEKNPEKANLIADYLKQSADYLVIEKENAVQTKREPLVFISYSNKDSIIADNLCFKLESQGVKVWYAPRNVVGPYAESIVMAIRKASHFIVILSERSNKSEHVLSEVNLAFQKLSDGIKIKPLKIDKSIFNPSFEYYLSRQHWMDATTPPLEERLSEFVKDFMKDLD